MRTTQYVRQEKAIAAADAGAIRERWLWGLRLLRDPEAYNAGSSQLKPHYAEGLVNAAAKAGLKLSVREIGYRMQMARAYPTEAQIAQACRDYATVSDLREAGFPHYEAPPGELPADHRTRAERQQDHARALLEIVGEPGSLFKLSEFEPTTSLLKELQDYTERQEELTARFVEHGKKRRAYLESLVEAADGDLSMTWQDAQDRLNAFDADSLDETEEPAA
jgi:hypothetical protein